MFLLFCFLPYFWLLFVSRSFRLDHSHQCIKRIITGAHSPIFRKQVEKFLFSSVICYDNNRFYIDVLRDHWLHGSINRVLWRFAWRSIPFCLFCVTYPRTVGIRFHSATRHMLVASIARSKDCRITRIIERGKRYVILFIFVFINRNVYNQGSFVALKIFVLFWFIYLHAPRVRV